MVIAWASGCDWGADPPVGEPPHPAIVTVTPTTAHLGALRATVQMTAEVRDQYGNVMPDAAVGWNTRVRDVAQIDTAGVVTAVSNGTDTVTATADTAVGTAVVTIAQTVTEVAVSPATDTLPQDYTRQMTAHALDANGHPIPKAEFQWRSTDTLVAVVDQSGRVRGVAGGSAAIVAKHAGVEGRSEVTVVSNPERNALVQLYNATGGPFWTQATNWLDEGSVGDWFGVAANDEGRVIDLDLGRNGLRGALPPQVGDLTHLRRLILPYNSLTGPIPSELGDLADLELLDMRFSGLTGPIPWELGNLVNLTQLHLSLNPLTGSIPPELGNLTNLQQLYLNDTDLTGPIPPELGQLASLTHLGLYRSSLSGPIPPELGGLRNLRVMSLIGNSLTESIPSELGNLESLIQLDLTDNSLTGLIPAELTGLPNLLYLHLDGNDLEGPIPASMYRLRSLTSLNLGANGLTGAIPSGLGGLTDLTRLHLGDNELTGAIPAELGRLASLTRIDLGDNELTGAIPPDLGNLNSISRIRLANNQLSGPLPATLGNLTGLQVLDVANNAGLSGPLPRTFLSLGQVEELRTSGTELCAPMDRDFRNWMDRVLIHRTSACGAQGVRAYLTQAVQSREYPVTLVAGDDALLRVFVVATQHTSETIPEVQATFYRNGRETHAVNIPGKPAPIPTEVDESSLSVTANAMVPGAVVESGLEMVVEIDPNGTLDPGLGVPKRIPESGRAWVGVREFPSFDLTVIPYLWNEDPDSSILELVAEVAADPAGHELLEETRMLLPVGELDMTAHPPVDTDTNNILALLVRTEAIRVMEGGAGYYMGTMAGQVTYAVGIAYWPGRASFSIPVPWLIAHELGHNMNLGRAPCGVSTFLDPDYPHPDGTTGSWGYHERLEILVTPLARDLMSNCIPRWISDYSFSKALRYRLADEVALSASAGGTPGMSLLLWGGVDPAGAPFLNPVFVVDAPTALPWTGGDHQLTGHTASGEELFSFRFKMQEIADGGLGSFAFALPVEPEWAAELAEITLAGPGGSVVLDGESGDPMVILRDMRTGQVRAILSDLPSGVDDRVGAAAALRPEPDFKLLFSRGIPDSTAWRR